MNSEDELFSLEQRARETSHSERRLIDRRPIGGLRGVVSSIAVLGMLLTLHSVWPFWILAAGQLLAFGTSWVKDEGEAEDD